MLGFPDRPLSRHLRPPLLSCQIFWNPEGCSAISGSVTEKPQPYQSSTIVKYPHLTEMSERIVP